ncbi:MAG: protein of unknown function DUF752 [uncultured bacterium]|nr:MAG: protein of unknown function DUF752 [uncultured bacterium]HLD44858.1 tRNA (5-methylaminomethyl-2-thiouridine)(34)-methyltransferase MnmD [bacterium]
MTQNFSWFKTDDGSYTLHRRDIDEIYHSRSGALTECRHVYLNPFLQSSPQSHSPTWRVLDVGFGLGYNWLCYVNETYSNGQNQSPPPDFLDITSIEHEPEILTLPVTNEHLKLGKHQEELLNLLAEYKHNKVIARPHLRSQLMIGDLKEKLNQLVANNAKFDVILHDPFSPSKTPECWSHEVFSLLRQCCDAETMLLTYSVAGHVRRALTEAGFEVKKIPGHGTKREQLIAFYRMRR